MKRYPKVKCKKCKYKGSIIGFVTGLGSLLECPKCGYDFYPPVVKRRRKKK